MSPTLVRPRNRPELTEQFGPRITQEGTVYMDNNTTLNQWSLQGTIKSSRKIVNNNHPWRSSMDDLQMSLDDQTFLRQTDEYTTLGKISTLYSSY